MVSRWWELIGTRVDFHTSRRTEFKVPFTTFFRTRIWPNAAEIPNASDHFFLVNEPTNVIALIVVSMKRRKPSRGIGGRNTLTKSASTEGKSQRRRNSGERSYEAKKEAAWNIREGQRFRHPVHSLRGRKWQDSAGTCRNV